MCETGELVCVCIVCTLTCEGPTDKVQCDSTSLMSILDHTDVYIKVLVRQIR